jgi:hypothetical protein
MLTVIIPKDVAFPRDAQRGGNGLPRHPSRLISWLRRQLREVGLADVLMVGHLEVDYARRDRTFDPHFHLYLAQPSAEQIKKLKTIRKRLDKRAIRVDPVDDEDRAAVISYGLKCYAMEKNRRGGPWPEKRRLGGKLGRAILRWIDAVVHDDFLFLQGVRRHRGKLRLV